MNEIERNAHGQHNSINCVYKIIETHKSNQNQKKFYKSSQIRILKKLVNPKKEQFFNPQLFRIIISFFFLIKI